MAANTAHSISTSDKDTRGSQFDTEGSTISPLNEGQRVTTEKEVLLSSDEKEALISPTHWSEDITGTDKETFSRTTDSSKEVVSPTDDDVDTSKIFVPQAPPISMDKELAPAPSSAAQAIINDPSTPSLIPTNTSTSFSTSSHNILAFRLEKKHTMGLILYQNQQIAIHPISLSTGHLQPIAFVTSSMSFIEAMLGQPPLFELMVPNTHPPLQVGRWVPLGLEGIIRMRGEFEAMLPSPPGSSEPNRTEKWEMKRKGVIWPGRTYDMWKQDPGASTNNTKRDPDVAWKGSTRTVRDTLKNSNLSALQQPGESTKHGSLKLVSQGKDGALLALWNQWRDSETLGDLLIFEAARGRISVEAIVTSVIAVVHAERVTGVHWVGGVGK